jgi:hypothetical protein
MFNRSATAVVCSAFLFAPWAHSANEKIDSYDAVELNKQLIGNEIKAGTFKGKEIQVSGGFYGSMRVVDSKTNKPAEPEAYLVTFTGFGGIGEALHVRCLFYDTKGLAQLKKGAPIKVKGKVVTVVKDTIVIEATLVK